MQLKMRGFMTILHYLQEDARVLNTQLFKSACDERGTYLVFNATIFHSQGGGQPSDTGTIIFGDYLIEISHVRKQEDEVRHYSADTSVPLVPQEAFPEKDASQCVAFSRSSLGPCDGRSLS